MNQGERGDGRTGLPALGRRRFLIGSAAAAAALAVGCSSDGSDGGSPSPGTDGAGGASSTTTTAAVAPEPVNVPTLASDPFTLGVASGDPLADAVVIWTRLAPEALAADGAGGMPAEEADVIWEVSLTDDFAELVAAGLFTTSPLHGHSVHVDVTDLPAGTDLSYRFRYADWTSPVGRTRTLATGSPDRFAVAVANCQWYEMGEYGAYANLAAEDLDLVLHLGDYIYEYPGGTGARASEPKVALTTLAHYRLRYASYKTDPHLQAAHARFPFVVTWDDHEVANNYMGDVLPGSTDETEGQARKQAAYQAWWENLPVRVAPPDGSDLTVHQSFAAGDLVRVHVLDERQDAAVPPCRDTAQPGTDYGDCDAREGEDRTRLGADQEAWLEGSLAEGGVTWNLLGNPVVLAGVDGGTDQAAYYLDTWDGFPQARSRLIEQLAAVDNPVVLTGDYHAGMVLDVNATPFDRTSAVVAPEFMAPPISSVLFPDDVSARTPQLRQQINQHGYLVVEVTPERLTATFRVLDDVLDAASAVTTAATWVVDAGDPVARPA